jgi:general secretion pathway protein D
VILRPRISLATLLVVALAGCANLPRSHDELSREMAATAAVPVKLPRPVTNEEAPIKITTEEKSKGLTKPEILPGSGSLLNEEAAKKPVAGVSSEEGQITLNYENVPIQGVVQNILGALLKENYTIAPTVTGNVTFSTAKPITAAQAMPILEMLLSWTNNALVVKEGRYEVLPIKDALPGNLTPRIAPPQLAKGYEARAFPLKYIAPVEMQKLLKPYAKADAFVSYDNARNFIVMAGTASELANYARTIEVFDVDWLKGMSVGVYGLRNSDVSKVMPDLEKVFGATGESPLAGMFRFIPMETTNSVVVITSQPEYLKQAETWLYRLDAGVGENGTQLYVYDVKNVKAVDLSDHLNAIFTGQVSQRSTSGNVAPGLKAVSIGQFNSGNSGRYGAMSTPTLGGKNPQQLTENRNAAGATSNLSTTGTGTAPGQTPSGKQTDIRITPIEENNQLLVMATPGEWDSILAAIHRLDVSPLQVHIEAKILEVKLSGDLKYGVQWWLSGLINSNTGVNPSTTGFTYGRQPAFSQDFQGNTSDRHRSSLGGSSPVSVNGGPGLFYSFLNKNFQVALDALQSTGNTKVLSTPSLVVMNNQEAQITVGTQVSVISNSINYVGGTTNASNSSYSGVGTASYISTGVTLDITPRVNPGGLVYMDVNQEDTVPNYNTVTSNNPNPSIDQRNLKTQIAVQSGETVLLGGMISDTEGESKNGVPLLSSIPLVGGLFGSTTKNHDRTELIILITPHVVTNPDEAREMTQEYQQKFESLKPLRAKQEAAPAAEPMPVPPAPAPPPAPAESGAVKPQESHL